MNRLLFLSALLLVLCSACGKPNAANITLRKQNQDLQSRVDQLQRELGATKASVAALESNATTVPVLPSQRLEKLFTTHGIQIGRLTGEADLDPTQPGNEGMKLYVVPTDQHSQPLKAAGTFTVEAFDLSQNGENRIGRWEFPIEKGQENFYSMFMLYTYAFPLPWQQLPKAKTVTLRVAFTDALTGRTFTEQKAVDVTASAARMAAATTQQTK